MNLKMMQPGEPTSLKMIVVALFAACAAGSAIARETGIINQAGPYEETMRFYLHPAHGFPGAAQPHTASADDRGATAQSPAAATARASTAPKDQDALQTVAVRKRGG